MLVHARAARPNRLLLDRFVAFPRGPLVDLASGKSVWIRERPDVRRSHQAEWSDSCLALLGTSHQSVVSLIDFGIGDDGVPLEVFDVAGPPEPIRLTARAAERLRRRVGSGPLTATRRSDRDGELVVAGRLGLPALLPMPSSLPSVATVRRTGSRKFRSEDDLGAVKRMDWRLEIAAVEEALRYGATGGARTLFLQSPAGFDVERFWMSAARAARLVGFVPVSTAMLADGLRLRIPGVGLAIGRFLRGRHLLIFHDSRAGTTPAECGSHRLAMARLVPILAAGRRPNLVIVARPSVGAGGIRLVPGSHDAVELAGRRRGPYAAVPIAADASAPYSGADAAPGPSPLAVDGVGPALRLVRNGLELVSSGRHAPADRLMRRALGALERRHQLPHAGWTAIRLAAATLRLGRTGSARTLYERARRMFERGGVAAGAICASLGIGLAETDADDLSQAESTLRSALAAATAIGEPGLVLRSRVCLARCLFWQSRWDEASREIELLDSALTCVGVDASPTATADSTAERAELAYLGGSEFPSNWSPFSHGIGEAEEVSLRVSASALASRVALALEQGRLAGTRAALAAQHASMTGRPLDVWTAERVMAELQAAFGDASALRSHVARAAGAARRLRLPLFQLRLRLILADGLHRAGRGAESRRVWKRLTRADAAQLPALVRRHFLKIRERCAMAGSALPVRDVESLSSFAGQSGAAGPISVSVRGLGSAPDLASEFLAFAAITQETEDPASMLERVCARVRERLGAVAALVVARTPDGVSVLASSGAGMSSNESAERAMALGEPIGPVRRVLTQETAWPLKAGGESIGALAVRWAVDRTADPACCSAVLTAAAAVVPAAVRGLVHEPISAGPSREPGSGLIGVSKALVDLRLLLQRAASSPFPVLIQGESGTGKELAARQIHGSSQRRSRRFCAVNCAALGDDLLEAELFGHAKGSFTGAIAERAGLFESADGGTLFLDEIGELSARAQAKLLRVLQEGEVRRIGENLARSVDVRIVAATNRFLRDEVQAGRFRQDLLYRLDVISIHIPALRHRPEDVAVLAARFWDDARCRTGSRAVLAPAVMTVLSRYSWPGNARELQNVLAAMAATAPQRGTIGTDALPESLRSSAQPVTSGHESLEEARHRFERDFIRAAISRAGGRRGRAACDLGLTRQGLSKLIARLGIDLPA